MPEQLCVCVSFLFSVHADSMSVLTESYSWSDHPADEVLEIILQLLFSSSSHDSTAGAFCMIDLDCIIIDHAFLSKW